MTQIYCTHCGKRLQADKTISFCTTCGKKLPEVIEEEKTYTDMGALLRGVRDEYGIEVFKDAFKVKGILRDKAPELQKEIQLFSVALDSSAFSLIGAQVSRTVMGSAFGTGNRSFPRGAAFT